MNATHLRRYVIEPTLDLLDHADPGIASTAAVELLLGTAAQESRLQWLRQLGGGPALGLWQLEPATARDIWHRTIPSSPRWQEVGRMLWPLASSESVWSSGAEGISIGERIGSIRMPNPNELMYNLRYACAMARVLYRRVRAPLPAAGDLPAQAGYWKRYYNTHLGAGTVEQYIASWHEVVEA